MAQRPGAAAVARRAAVAAAAALLAAAGLGGCSGSGGTGSSRTPSARRDPSRSVAPKPDYSQVCSPSGVDTSTLCLQVTLKAVDNARAREGLDPMVLPEDFPKRSVAEQVFIAVDRERTDRGLGPVAGVTADLTAVAQRGADAGDVPPDPGGDYHDADTAWLGGVTNGLDAVYRWMYDDGAGSGVADCDRSHHAGCWADRHIVLDDFAPGATVLMGVALDPTGDRQAGGPGGPSLGMVIAEGPPSARVQPSWASVLAASNGGRLVAVTAGPANTSATHIPDPPRTLPPDPDYIAVCSSAGLDSSDPCLDATLRALNNARAKEGVAPMRLPARFAELTIPQQLLVAINLERVDRSLPPFAGLTAALNRNAQKGADTANDPPDPGGSYDVVDGEWAGGSVNGLDAVYGWMYDDGPGSTNLDCPENGGPGCWGHRHGILDDFGAVGTLVMGAAVNPTGDTNKGDEKGPSMAATLAITSRAPEPFTFSWADVAPPRTHESPTP